MSKSREILALASGYTRFHSFQNGHSFKAKADHEQVTATYKKALKCITMDAIIISEGTKIQ